MHVLLLIILPKYISTKLKLEFFPWQLKIMQTAC